MKGLMLIAIVLAVAVTPACTTITRGSSESYAIETEPAGAEAKVTDARGTLQCTTPCSLKVKRRGQLHVVIAKEGFEVIDTHVASSVDGAGAAGMAGNVLIGGLIGAAIDAGSGAMHSHKPNPLHVVLVPSHETASKAEATTTTESETSAEDDERRP